MAWVDVAISSAIRAGGSRRVVAAVTAAALSSLARPQGAAPREDVGVAEAITMAEVLAGASQLHDLLAAASGGRDSHSLALAIRSAAGRVPSGLHKRMRQLACSANALRHTTRAGLRRLLRDVPAQSAQGPGCRGAAGGGVWQRRSRGQ